MKRCNHRYSDWSYDADSRHRVCLECGDVDAEGLEVDDAEFARVYEPSSEDIGKSIANEDSEV